MANSAFSSIAGWITGQSAFQAINELTGVTLWDKIGVVRVEVPSEAEETKEPLSNIQFKTTGSYLNLLETDIQAIKIIKPSRMRITAICGDLSTQESIVASQKDLLLTITVFTKSVISENLVITDVTFEQTPDSLSATKVTIECEQGIAPSSTQFNPAQPGDQSALGFRIQQPSVSSTTVAGLFSKVASKVTNVVKPIAGALLGNDGGPFALDSSKLG